MPLSWPRSCARSPCPRSPTVMNRWPSASNARREPKCLLAPTSGSAVKITSRSSSRPSPSRGARDPRAVAAVALGRIGQVDHAGSSANSGSSATSSKPALAARVDLRHALDRRGIERPVAHDAQPSGPLGDRGCSPSGRNAMPHGCSSPVDDRTTRNVACSELIGSSDAAAPFLAAAAGDECTARRSQGCPSRSRRSHASLRHVVPSDRWGDGRSAHGESRCRSHAASMSSPVARHNCRSIDAEPAGRRRPGSVRRWHGRSSAGSASRARRAGSAGRSACRCCARRW